MQFGSLFTGIGGFDLGLERAGMTCAWQCEIDPQCREVLTRRFPGVPCYEDVKEVHAASFLDSRVRTFYNPTDGVAYTPEEADMAGRLKKLTPAQAEQCVAMYDSGLSLQPIADYFEVSRQAMWDLLRRRTTMRPQKRYGNQNHFYRGGKGADDPAQNLVETALQQGILIRPEVCSECGNTQVFKDGRSGIQAHHCDYNKPLEVLWLCQKCHHKWHSLNAPIKKEVAREVPQVDLICGGFP